MEQKEKRGRGRPALPTADRGRSVRVYMPPDVEVWLKQHPDGMSKAIAMLVRKEMKTKPANGE